MVQFSGGRSAAYEQKTEHLNNFVRTAGQENSTPNYKEIEERFALGELSREEYERLKASSSPATTDEQKPCSSCGKQIQAGFKFCPFCGKTA